MFAFAPAGIQVFTDSPHFDEGGAHFKEAAKTGAMPHNPPRPNDTMPSAGLTPGGPSSEAVYQGFSKKGRGSHPIPGIPVVPAPPSVSPTAVLILSRKLIVGTLTRFPKNKPFMAS